MEHNDLKTNRFTLRFAKCECGRSGKHESRGTVARRGVCGKCRLANYVTADGVEVRCRCRDDLRRAS